MMGYKTRQVIEIDVTWTGYKKLRLKWVLQKILETELDIERINIREVKKR